MQLVVREVPTFRCHSGERINAQHHVLRWCRNGTTVCRGKDVVARKHQDPSLSLCFSRERYVYCHLVTVEVCVECSTHEWVNLNCLTFNELWFKCLDTQTVKCWCTVQQHRVLGNNFFQDVPHNWAGTLNHALSTLDVLSVVKVDEALHDKWLEEFKRHLLGQATLMQFELWTNNDHRTTGVVNALAQKVLAETTLLALEHVRE